MIRMLKRVGIILAALVFGATLAAPTRAHVFPNDKKPPGTKSGFITTPDGVKIHYLEAGRPKIVGSGQISPTPPSGAVITKGEVSLEHQHPTPAILFIPGWTMPAWIWEKQIVHFSPDYRVIAMDPRSQGESSRTTEGLYPAARARDIKALVDQLHLAPVILVGWSMAVTELAAYVDQFGTRDIAGLVLVDDDVGGSSPAQAQENLDFVGQILRDREKVVTQFIQKQFFKKPQPDGYVARVIRASLQVPTNTAVALLVGKFSADYRAVLPKIDRPTAVCAAKSPYMSGILDMQKLITGSKLEIFDGAGHALFVDDSDKFNAMLEDFLAGLR